jgi:hypothetical protein
MQKSKFTLIVVLFFLFSCNSNSNETVKKEILKASEIYTQYVDATCTVLTNEGLGSGFFIDSNIIVTNFHVIENAKYAKINIGDELVNYNVLGTLGIDKDNDLALLLVEKKNKHIISIEYNLPNPGDHVFAIGSPVGLPKSITDGLISGKRNFNGRTLLQISSPISHGSSGGPILNEYGELVGISVGGIESGNNVNFCIPTSCLKTLIDFKSTYPTKINQDSKVTSKKDENTEVTTSENSNSNSNPRFIKNKSFKIPYKECYGFVREELLKRFHDRRDPSVNSRYDYIVKNSIRVYEFNDSWNVWNDNLISQKCIKYVIVYTIDYNNPNASNPWSDEREMFYDISFNSANGCLTKKGSHFGVIENAGYGGFYLEKCR